MDVPDIRDPYTVRVDWLIFAGVVVALVLLGVLAQRKGWIDLSSKSAQKRGGSSSGSVLSIGDEVFNPARYEAQLEQDRQTQLPAPAPVAGDGDKDVYKGSVRIDLR
jgi:hypothetical protein